MFPELFSFLSEQSLFRVGKFAIIVFVLKIKQEFCDEGE